MDHAGFIVFILLIAIVGYFFSFGRREKAQGFLQDWAHENGLQLIACERRAVARKAVSF